mgnify:CR=1 FL=1
METPRTTTRLTWLDQCRGYAILAMVFVNLTNEFDASPWWLRHHRDILSYNDTIAPLFMFLVGLGFNMSFAKHAGRDGLAAARKAAVRRYALLTLIGAIIYMGYFWDAFTDIGLAGLLALPIIHRSGRVRAGMAVGCLAAYQAIASWTPYGARLMDECINGGPVGVLNWCAMLLFGTLAWDWLREGRFVRNSLGWGVAFTVAGMALRMPWGAFKAAWPYSQYGMSLSYTVLSIGLCFLTVLLFERACGAGKLSLPVLPVFGKNPFAIYLFHWALILPLELFVPGDVGKPVVLGIAAGVCAGCYLFARVLDWRGIVVKL